MGAIRKVRRCKFCRSKAKYLPGQRSLDAVSAKLFRRKKSPEPNRRAASEDRCGWMLINELSKVSVVMSQVPGGGGERGTPRTRSGQEEPGQESREESRERESAGEDFLQFTATSQDGDR